MVFGVGSVVLDWLAIQAHSRAGFLEPAWELGPWKGTASAVHYSAGYRCAICDTAELAAEKLGARPEGSEKIKLVRIRVFRRPGKPHWSGEKQQVPPLRYAPVGMTIL